jgi:tetratricopeptide (TPR) repeat protein
MMPMPVVPARIAAATPAWTWALLIAIATALAFCPSLDNEFVDWDDEVALVTNTALRRGPWDQVRWAFTTVFLGPYQPLSWLSLGLDYRLWGLNPLGFHLTALIWHVASAVGMFALSRRLLAVAMPNCTGCPASWNGAAAIAALWYAVHPLRVESVAWATERRDVLCQVFAIATLLAYAQHAATGASRVATRWLVIAWALHLAALLSKASAVPLPAVLTLIDYYPLRRLPGAHGRWVGPAVRAIWLEKLPFWALSLIFAFVAIHGQTTETAISSTDHLGLVNRLALAAYSSAFYVGKSLVPWNLSPMYELSDSFSPWQASVILGAIATLLLSGFALWGIRRLPAWFVTWGAYLVLLAPVSGLVHTGFQCAADRYSYLPGLALALLPAGLLLQCQRRGALRPGLATAVWCLAFATIPLLAAATWRQCDVWQNSETLWNRALAVDPGSGVAKTGLGVVRFRQGRLAESRVLLEAALRLRPSNVFTHQNLGLVLDRLGERAAARDQFLEAIRLQPRYWSAMLELARQSADERDWPAAQQWYEQCLAIHPLQVRALTGLADVYVRALNRPHEAVRLYRRALALDPADARAHNNLGILLRQMGDADSALRHYQTATQLQPASSEFCYNLGVLYEDLRDWPAAMQWYERCLKLEPQYVAAMNNLANVCKRQGLQDRALELYRKALAIDATSTDVRYNLAFALAEQQAYAEAETEYRRVLDRLPAHIPAAVQLALLLDRTNRSAEALARLKVTMAQVPDHPMVLYHTGWLLATSANDSVRNGAEALTLAQQLATRAADDAEVLDLLAAAYAAVGQFDTAVTTATRAAERARATGRQQLAADVDARVALYRQGKPFRRGGTPN